MPTEFLFEFRNRFVERPGGVDFEVLGRKIAVLVDVRMVAQKQASTRNMAGRQKLGALC